MSRPCWVFDLVFSTVGGGWGWAAGTDIAASYVSGIAALIKSRHPDASPQDVRTLMLASAEQSVLHGPEDEAPAYGNARAVPPQHTPQETAHAPADDAFPPDFGSGAFRSNEHENPTEFELYQNYPNPFSPLTTINFHVSEPTRVYMAVYDMMGPEVATLVDEKLPPGCYDTFWNGRDESGGTVASGVYMYKITAGSFATSRVMTFAND